MDCSISSACRRRNDFQKADHQGKNPFAKGFSPWTPFPKTPKWLRSGHKPVTGSLTRTRPEEAYLGVLGAGTGGRLSCKKEPPDSLRSKGNNPFQNMTAPNFTATVGHFLSVAVIKSD
jgi:hypothetical protein